MKTIAANKVNKAREYTETTLKRLFALSGNMCALPTCENHLIHTDGTVIAEICHIEAASEKGERYNESMTDDQRRSFDNLILLCSNCHKITNNEDIYTVPVLQQIKKTHEEKYDKENYQPNALLVDKIISQFAYDLSFTEQEEWGILEEIIKFVNDNAPRINPTFEQAGSNENITRLTEKVRLNFPKEHRRYFSDAYLSTNAKQQTITKFLENLAADDSIQVDELIEYVITKYREINEAKIADEPISNMKIIDELASQLIPAAKRSSPEYYATAKAIVIQSFEYCHIGQKTDYERSQNPSLFD